MFHTLIPVTHAEKVSKDATNYKHLVAIINGRNIAPDDAQVIMNDWVKPGYIVVRFSSSAWNWKSGSLPQRISKLHPVVAELRSGNRLDNIGASPRSRAYRLLQALVREAQARGHKVRVSKRPSQYGYGEQVGGIVGGLVFDVNNIRCALSVSEPQDRVPHVATETELTKVRRDTWYRIPSHDYLKSGRLHFTLATNSGYQSKVGWQDTTKLRLESRLCDVIPLFEHWAALDAELGVHSTLSVPLLVNDRLIGAINCFARDREAFGQHAMHLAEMFAVPAAVAVYNAQSLTQARDTIGHLERALISRKVIDQAIGIMRSRHGGSVDDAFDRLRHISQGDNVKLAAVAQQIVDESVREAPS